METAPTRPLSAGPIRASPKQVVCLASQRRPGGLPGTSALDSKIGLGAKVVSLAQEEGLICRSVAGDTIGICPPLIIKDDEIEAMFDMLRKALDKAHVWARAEGHLG